MQIDWWTLGLEAVNVAVLVWLLGRFFWRPVAAVIEKRQQAVARMLAEAEAGRKRLDEAADEIAQTRAGFTAEREQILARARADGEKLRSTVLDDAHRRAAGIEDAARRAAEEARAAEQRVWADRASRLAVDIAGRLAARLAGPAVLTAFLEWLRKAIDDLPEASRETVRKGAPLRAVTASDLSQQDRETVADMLDEAFGGPPSLTFETDPGIIAGVELHGPHFALENSWRADLKRILEETSLEAR